MIAQKSLFTSILTHHMKIDGLYRDDKKAIYLMDVTSNGEVVDILDEGEKVTLETVTKVKVEKHLLFILANPELYQHGVISNLASYHDSDIGLSPIRFNFRVTKPVSLADLDYVVKLYILSNQT